MTDDEQPQEPPSTLPRLLLEAALCEARVAAVDGKITDAVNAVLNLRTQRAALAQELRALRGAIDRAGGGFDIRGLNGDPQDKHIPQRLNRAYNSWEER
jgi:hypothetical protein